MDGVMMLVNEFFPLQVGGAERQAERLSRFLAGHGWKVSILTRGTKGLAANQEKDGFRIFRIRPFGPGKVKSLTFTLGSLRTLWKERKHYQILHAHLAFGPAFSAVMMGRILRKPTIVKLGNSGNFGDIQLSRKTWRGRARLFFIRRWVNIIIVLDAKMEAEALENGFRHSQIRRMSNGIEGNYFQKCEDKLKAKAALGLGTNLMILYTGRLDKQKSLTTLINAAAIVTKEISSILFVLVGDGPERQKLEETVLHLNLNDKVKFTGHKDNVLPYLSAADIFVLPSLSEGISNSLLEAMACSLACIATSIGGTHGVIQESGVLIEINNHDQLAREILRLYKKPDEINRLGNLARQRIMEEYDFEVVGQNYIKLYHELLHGHSSLKAVEVSR